MLAVLLVYEQVIDCSGGPQQKLDPAGMCDVEYKSLHLPLFQALRAIMKAAGKTALTPVMACNMQRSVSNVCCQEAVVIPTL